MGQVQRIRGRLDQAQDAIVDDHLLEAIDLLAIASQDMEDLRGLKSTRVVGVLSNRADELRNAIIEVLDECWDALIESNSAEKYLRIKSEVQRKSLWISGRRWAYRLQVPHLSRLKL